MFWHSLQLEQRVVSIHASSDGGGAAAAEASAAAAGAASAIAVLAVSATGSLRRPPASAHRSPAASRPPMPPSRAPAPARHASCGCRRAPAGDATAARQRRVACISRVSTITRCSRRRRRPPARYGTRSAASLSAQREPVGDRQHGRRPAFRAARRAKWAAWRGSHSTKSAIGEADAFAARAAGPRRRTRTSSTGQSSSGLRLFSSENRVAQLVPASAS